METAERDAERAAAQGGEAGRLARNKSKQEATLGLGRTVALYHRSFASYQIR
jgi:hypothetical protein